MTGFFLKSAAASIMMAGTLVTLAPVAQAQERAPMRLALKSDCGGLNQKSCWHVNPKKWCDEGLQYVRGTIGRRGRCVAPPEDDNDVIDETPGCGGIGEASCWSFKASRWCDPGLIYKPGGIPGRGRCEAAEEDNMLQYTRAVASRYKALGPRNEFAKLRNCLIVPTRLSRLKREMKDQDTNGTNSIIAECDVDLKKLQEVADYVLDTTDNAAARGVGVRSVRSSNDDDGDGQDNLGDKLRFTIELSGAASAGTNSFGGTIGYAVPLHAKPKGSRWYKGSDDFAGGVDLGVGADILFGIGQPGVPAGDNAVESGESGVLSGAIAAKVGVMVRATDDGGAMFALFGGVGLGVTAAVFDFQNRFYPDK